jgi:hypothetical protein
MKTNIMAEKLLLQLNLELVVEVYYTTYLHHSTASRALHDPFAPSQACTLCLGVFSESPAPHIHITTQSTCHFFVPLCHPLSPLSTVLTYTSINILQLKRCKTANLCCSFVADQELFLQTLQNYSSCG